MNSFVCCLWLLFCGLCRVMFVPGSDPDIYLFFIYVLYSSCSVLKEQIKLRDNALQQASVLMDYKRAFCHFGGSSSTRENSNNRNNQKPQRNGLFAIFVALLAEPLSRVGNARTDNDHLTIELIIYLFRNLLIAEPILNTNGASTIRSSTSTTNDIHYELITIFDQELVLDILYVLCADIEQRENVSYNLLLMELLQLLFKHQNPITIAAINNHSLNPASARLQLGTVAAAAPSSSSSDKNSLLRSIQREKQTIQSCSTSRHSHFGGTIVLENKSNGLKQLIGASLFNAKQSQSTTTLSSCSNSITQQQQLLLLSRRKNKNLEPFIGAKSSHHHALSTSSTTTAAVNTIPYVSSWHKKSMQSLHQFCTIFVLDQKCYGPLMKSLKNEFRRDSVRLEDNDRIVYFQVVAFFCTWYRTQLKIKQQNADTGAARSVDPNDDCVESDRHMKTASQSSIGQLIFTMDVFSFNLVLNATDTFQEHKKYGPLSHSVALLREMMHLLYMMMQNSSTDSNQNMDATVNATEQIMAMGLMDRLFYASEPLDRLPKLLSRWTPGTSTREYVCDLVEIAHMSLQVLEANANLCRSVTDKSSNNDNDAVKHDTVAKMKAMAIEFDVESYFVRKIVSNHTITMYTHLLSCYSINSPEINQYIISFFERVRQHVLSSPSSDDIDLDDDEDDDELLVMKNPFAPKIVTMEPMLYNAQLFIVLNNILNDTAIRSDPTYAGLINFATAIVHNFAVAAQSNPVLFVEVLFKHPSSHRFCDMITNSYVTEDLRMLVERDILLQQQYQLEQEVEAFTNHQEDVAEEKETARTNTNTNDRDDSSESSDEELEFTDVPLDDEPILGKRNVPKSTNQNDDDASKRARTKSILSDSDEE